jgi:hypothetical protein
VSGTVASYICPRGFIAFVSTAENLQRGVSGQQIYLFDPGQSASPSVFAVSVSAHGAAGNGLSDAPSLRVGGTFPSPPTYDVAFESTSTNLVAGDTNDVSDVFVRTAPAP